MPDIVPLQSEELPATCFVFKHSTACPVSAAAAAEVRAMDTDLTVYWINVIEQRGLSDWVAAEYGVRHESPQFLLIVDGRLERTWSHGQITREIAGAR